MNNRLTDARRREALERRDQVLGFRRLGLSLRDIAARVGISHVAVLKMLKKWDRGRGW